MELIFDPMYGGGYGVHHQFTIEVGHTDSVLQIKQKIQDLKGVPISRQTLMFNDVVLDDVNIRLFQIVDGSTIQLFIHNIFSPIQSRTDAPPDQCSLIASRRNLFPLEPTANVQNCPSTTQTHAAAGNQPQKSRDESHTGDVKRAKRQNRSASSAKEREIIRDQSGKQTDNVRKPPSSSRSILAPSSNQTPIQTQTAAGNQPIGTTLQLFTPHPVANVQNFPGASSSSRSILGLSSINQTPTQTQGASVNQITTTIHPQYPVHGIEASSSSRGKRVREDIVEGSGNPSTGNRPQSQLMLVTFKYQDLKINLKVHPQARVSELMELAHRLQWILPETFYFFNINSRMTLNANHSFLANGVSAGDNIEIIYSLAGIN